MNLQWFMDINKKINNDSNQFSVYLFVDEINPFTKKLSEK